MRDSPCACCPFCATRPVTSLLDLDNRTLLRPSGLLSHSPVQYSHWNAAVRAGSLSPYLRLRLHAEPDFPLDSLLPDSERAFHDSSDLSFRSFLQPCVPQRLGNCQTGLTVLDFRVTFFASFHNLAARRPSTTMLPSPSLSAFPSSRGPLRLDTPPPRERFSPPNLFTS